MQYLVDTHILLWWLTANKRLKPGVKALLKDPKNAIFVSVVSGWEISIKQRNGKLPLQTTVQECFEKSGFLVKEITLAHVLTLDRLPQYHNDPFDRMLIAQAKADNLTLITDDPTIQKYPIQTRF